MMQRPTSVTVFGVLNLIFGLLGVFGMAFTVLALFVGGQDPFPLVEQSAFLAGWTKFSTIMGSVATIALAVSGIGLLQLRPWGRNVSIAYSIYAIAMVIVATAINYKVMIEPLFEQMEQAQGAETETMVALVAGVVGGMVGSLFSLIYSVLLWFYMTRPHVVAAFSGKILSQSHVERAEASVSPPSDNPFSSPVSDEPAIVSTPARSEAILESVIPAKNGAALTSYYLGLFSLFPLLGFPLAVAAVVLGVKGLKNVRRDPTVRGGVHAWIGLICGALFGLFNLALLGGLGFAILSSF